MCVNEYGKRFTIDHAPLHVTLTVMITSKIHYTEMTCENTTTHTQYIYIYYAHTIMTCFEEHHNIYISARLHIYMPHIMTLAVVIQKMQTEREAQ
jgi:hypothetical protein